MCWIKIPGRDSSRLGTHCVEQLQFPGENDSMRELGVAMAVLHVLESLEVKGQDLG